jgi:hypothetical protein
MWGRPSTLLVVHVGQGFSPADCLDVGQAFSPADKLMWPR